MPHRGWMRLAAYVGALAIVVGFLGVHSARAREQHGRPELGQEMVPLADLLTERARVEVNGEHLWVANALSALPIHEILERFESACRAQGAIGATWGSGGDGATLREKLSLDKVLGRKDAKTSKLELGVLRTERDDEGALICFPHEERDASPIDRLEGFRQTKDLGRLGRLRYTHVRREAGQSHIQTFWTDEHLRMDRLVGLGTEESGFDNPDLPRPIRARRVVSTAIDGTPYRGRGYLSQAAPGEVLDAYGREMALRGWKATGTVDGLTMGYLKDGSLVTIHAEGGADGTVVGIAEMGIDPTVSLPADSHSPRVIE